MVLAPLIGADKAWENTQPQLKSGIESILSRMGLKSILDMFSKPEFQNVIMPVISAAMGTGGMGGNMPSWSFAGPASKWPQTSESAGKVLVPFKEQPNIVDLMLNKRLGDLTRPDVLTPNAMTAPSDDLDQVLQLLGMK